VSRDPIALRDAFNLHAPTYDDRFARSASGQAMRHAVWSAADKVVVPTAHLLDLGCGTGEDAIHFAERGNVVTAVEIAPEMIAALAAKARATGLSGRINARVSRYRPV